MEMTTIQSQPTQNSPDLIVNMLLGLRDEWDRPGVEKAVKQALLKFDIELVRQVATDTARDVTARTPAVIGYRCQQTVISGKYDRPTAAPIVDLPSGHCGRNSCECDHSCCEFGWISDDSEQPCPICRPHMVQTGIEMARRRARDAALAPKPAAPEFVRALLADVKAGLPRHRNAEAGQPEG